MNAKQAFDLASKLPDVSVKDHFGSDGFSAHNNAWGRQGWTKVHLEYVEKSDFKEALQAAWEYSASKSVPLKSSKAKKAPAKKVPAKKTQGKKK